MPSPWAYRDTGLLTQPPQQLLRHRSLLFKTPAVFSCLGLTSNKLKVGIPAFGGFHSESRLLKAGRFP